MIFVTFNNETKLYSFNFLSDEKLEALTEEQRVEYAKQRSLWEEGDSDQLKELLTEAQSEAEDFVPQELCSICGANTNLGHCIFCDAP